MRAKEFIVETAMMDLSPQTIHKLADRKGVKWDNEPSFLQLTKRLTGKEHLDDLDHSGLNKVKRHLDGLQGMAEGFSNAVTFFRGEPILSQERLNQLKSSIGKPYPILRKEGSAANIGTYMSPDGDKATSFVKQALAGQGKGGVVTQIQVNPNSFSKGDGGIDEAVIITNIAGLVSNQTPNKNDPLRIQDRKQAMLKYLGPGVKKYLNDPLLSDPKIVQSWYNPEFAQKNWNTINSGKQAVTKPGESNIQERMIRILGPLAENIRRDPEVINYFISHNPGDWVEYNFRMNSDGSGTKVVDVKYYPPAKQGVAEEINPDILDPRFSHTQQIGDYTYIASVEIFLDEPILNIKAYDGDKEIGHVLFQIFDWEDDTSNSYMESGGTEVDPKYRGKGIATTMYAYAKMLGNDIIPSFNRTTQGKAMWAGWGQDAKHLRDVTEGQDDKAEAYRAHLIKTLPQIMKLFANIGKGWIPGKEQMLSAVDTAYIVMKHTGDVKQAGKALMDELNTLHRMSQGKQGVAENTATGINRMFNNLGDPVYSNLQRVALLAMQGRQSEAAGRLQSVIKDASTDIQKKITDAVNNIKPVTINGKIADSSTLNKSKQHNDWIINTFIPWVQSLLGKQGVAEGSLGTVLPWTEVVNKVSGAMKAMGWKGTRKADGTFMFSTRGQETDDQYYIVIIDNAGEGFFTYALGTIEEGDPRIGEQESFPNTEASVSELMNAIRDGFGLSEQGVAEEMQHKKITELFDAKTSFPLKWDTQFASRGEVHAEAYDADGRIIDISFTPTGYGSGIEIVFKRGGSYDMTGHGDAPRVLATVVNAISQYLQKYQPPYIAFSAKSTGGRAGAYAAMIRRLARGYKLLTPDEYPDDTAGFLDFLGSDKPFILARS